MQEIAAADKDTVTKQKADLLTQAKPINRNNSGSAFRAKNADLVSLMPSLDLSGYTSPFGHTQPNKLYSS